MAGQKKSTMKKSPTGNRKSPRLAVRQNARTGGKKKKKGRKTRASDRTFYRSLVGCAVFFGVLFLGMAAYVCIYISTHSEALFNNSYNSRQSVLAQKNTRGTIYSSDGYALAQTVTDEAGEEMREYPFANVFSHIVGYTGRGKTGLEGLANFYLVNTSASVSEQAENAAADRKNPGNNLITTLDAGLQQAAYDALGVYEGAIVVMEPSTGKILAMVSKPDFDPNRIAEIWDEVTSDEESSVLLNRASQGVYPPGSTFKIITALEYMRENPAGWKNYSYQCEGSYTFEDNTIRCFHGSRHGNVRFTRSFAKSCNASFANMGMTLDKGRYLATMEGLLINQSLPVDIPHSDSKVFLTEDSDGADMIQTVIGQGKTQMTPLHMCMITAAIANDGVLMRPYEMERIERPDGTVVKEFAPTEYGRLLSSQEAADLRGLMADVVEEGTATRLSDLSYTAAGKTGSAEFNGNKADSHAWFTGFAPVENPQIVVTVIIEGIGSGGDYAVPIARRVFDAWFGV